jgi:S-adenosylmethionine:tRNA ribosyltransferase-isomerase
MLHMQGNLLRDSVFSEFPALLRATDLLVMNDTRVLPARLFGHRSGSRAQRLSPHNPASRGFLHGQVEVLLTRRLAERTQAEGHGLAITRLPAAGEEQIWQALVRPGRKIMPGERLYFGAEADGEALLEAEVVERGEFGERTLRFLPVPDFFARLERLGHIPLPPYIDREDTAEDRERYQTVFARDPGSVAAPTAGLHFTDEILTRRLGDTARWAGNLCADSHRGGRGAQDSYRVVPDSRGDGGENCAGQARGTPGGGRGNNYGADAGVRGGTGSGARARTGTRSTAPH